MRIAQGMGARVTVVRLPMIVTQHPAEEGQDAHLVHGLSATLGVGIEQR